MNLTFQVNKPPAFIFTYLTDMQKFVSVHPVIYKIDALGDQHYLVYERLKVGFIPYSFRYPVTIESDADKRTVIIKATVMNRVHIEMRYAIRPDGPSSIVEEEIKFRTILPVKAMMGPIFKKQHQLLFKHIDQL